jgi:thiol-disulfide isomerase/thioredoxin
MLALAFGPAPALLAQQTPATPTPAAPAAPAAQPAPVEKPAPTLKVGDAAPEFKVEKFIKGDEFSGFEKGKVYVVEFWATWCGPCIMSMPHISELQREYKDKGVTIVGVNIWEDKNFDDATLKKVEEFVQKKGDGMDYTVAYDGGSKHMDTTWMKAAGRNGIPSAFLVDQTGTIAWMGHPMSLDMVLDEVITGKWDKEKGPAKIQAASMAFREAGEKYKEGLEVGNTAWEQAMKDYPVMGRTMKAQHFGAMRDRATLKRPEAKQLIVKAAEANFELSDQSEAGPHVNLARAYFIAGQTEKGQAAAKRALELAPEASRDRMAAWLKQVEEDAKAE